MVTIYDIAKKANVSPMTVSRVINKSSRTSNSTKEKVEKAIKELGYIPNSAARSLISKKTKILSLLITDITNPFFTKVARGAEDKAKQLGYQILLSNTDEDLTKEEEYIHTLLSTKVDGVLLAPTEDQSKQNIEMLVKYNVPFVLVDRNVKGIESDMVLGDSYEGTRKLIEHLVSLNHKNIALINGPSAVSTARARQQGYTETLKLAGIELNNDLISHINFKKDDVDQIVKRLLSLPKEKRPTAIFAANNMIALNTVRTLKKYGFKVPEDMSIVCFDDFELTYEDSPFLTTAVQPAYDFGYTGIQYLIERIEGTGPKDHRKIILPPTITFGKSSTVYQS